MAQAGVGRAAAHHQRGHYPVPTVREAGRLDCAMTNREARPHLVKSYKGMESPGFNGMCTQAPATWTAVRSIWL